MPEQFGRRFRHDDRAAIFHFLAITWQVMQLSRTLGPNN